MIKGDLIKLSLDGEFDVIIHGCNCFCTMGAGIAKAVRENFPEAFQADNDTRAGDRGKLGSFSHARIRRDGINLTVVNGYTQFNFSGKGVLVEYGAVEKLFKAIKKTFPKKRIGYPKIGAGLARGDWGRIKGIIDGELEGEDHTLVELA